MARSLSRVSPHHALSLSTRSLYTRCAPLIMADMTPISGYNTTYRIIKEGAGAAVTKGASVTVHATGVVKESGKKFWCVRLPVARACSSG